MKVLALFSMLSVSFCSISALITPISKKEFGSRELRLFARTETSNLNKYIPDVKMMGLRGEQFFAKLNLIGSNEDFLYFEFEDNDDISYLLKQGTDEISWYYHHNKNLNLFSSKELKNIKLVPLKNHVTYYGLLKGAPDIDAAKGNGIRYVAGLELKGYEENISYIELKSNDDVNLLLNKLEACDGNVIYWYRIAD